MGENVFGDPLINDSMRRDENFCAMARDHQKRTNADIRVKAPSGWMADTHPVHRHPSPPHSIKAAAKSEEE
jgi:hypothetical protein